MESELIYTIEKAAKYLKISTRTVKRRLKEGDFPEGIVIAGTPKKQIRAWKKTELDAFKVKLRPPHRPKRDPMK